MQPEPGLRPDPARVEQLFHQAAGMPPGERDAFLAGACAGDTALHQAVTSLLAAAQNAATTWDLSAIEWEARRSALDSRPAHPGEFFGPYRVLRRIAAGGMSFVYEALRDDAEFHKRVAIKFLQQGINDAAGVERFRVERQILAQLEHPHIARLLDGGTTGDGAPYLVMEYVDGVPIDQFVTGNALSRAERLRLFLQVCDAVQYAHRNLVVHRDLKPGNILVTRPSGGDPGTPKLLDFGIAKLLDAESAAAATTVGALTPEYASPEQVLGRSITTATDIYSLGVLLFVLLAERLPYRARAAQTAELMRAICEEEPDWEPGLGLIEGDLQPILNQALHKEPERRYLSVEQFAGDVRCYLAGLPVSARADTLFYRARKFVVRRAIPLAGAAALVLAILGGSAAALWQAHRAEQQRAIAQRRFEDARRLAYTVVHEIQPELANINGTVALRKTLIEKTLVYLEALSRDAADSPELMRELIDSYVALAEVSADASMSNVGDPRGAAQILRKAESLANTLLRVDPAAPESARSLIRFYGTDARYLNFYGSRPVALSYAQRALDLAERLAAAAPGDATGQEDLASSLMVVAAASGDATVSTVEDRQRRRRYYERALAIWQDLVRHHTPVKDRWLRNVALCSKTLSNIWSETGGYPRALEYGSIAREIDQRFLDQNPRSPAAQMDLAFDIGAIGWTYYLMHDYQKAAENMRANVALREKVVAANPGDHRAADRLAYALRDLAIAEGLLGERAAAERNLRRTADLYRRLSDSAPLVAQSLFRYAETAYDLGGVESKREGAGCQWFRKAVGLLDEYERTTTVSTELTEGVGRMRSAAAACGTSSREPISR